MRIFEDRLERGEGLSNEDDRRKSIRSRGSGTCKGPEAGLCTACVRTTRMAGQLEHAAAGGQRGQGEGRAEPYAS